MRSRRSPRSASTRAISPSRARRLPGSIPAAQARSSSDQRPCSASSASSTPTFSPTLGVDAPIAGFELYLDALPAAKRKGTAKPALDASDLQPVRRDFAFLLDRDVPAGDVVRAASGADRALISGVDVFDVFTGQGVPEGKKSLAIEVTLQPRDKTLTDAEIEAVAAKIVAAVTKATGGELRG